ncbi:MAG: hypothetical protein GY913_35660 [Proteobacteria bacterium]|nr:hypothetical protein [Pseudomonadota bacterium]
MLLYALFLFPLACGEPDVGFAGYDVPEHFPTDGERVSLYAGDPDLTVAMVVLDDDVELEQTELEDELFHVVTWSVDGRELRLLGVDDESFDVVVGTSAMQVGVPLVDGEFSSTLDGTVECPGDAANGDCLQLSIEGPSLAAGTYVLSEFHGIVEFETDEGLWTLRDFDWTP